LEEVRLDLAVPIRELFVYPERDFAAREAGDTSDEQPVLIGESADLEPVVRDAIVLALPFRPVCREDCPGLCPRCGASLVQEPDHWHEETDPRWSCLQGFFDRGEKS
jgi:uncharacterized protein